MTLSESSVLTQAFMLDQQTLQLMAEIFELLAKYDMSYQDFKRTLEDVPQDDEEVIDF